MLMTLIENVKVRFADDEYVLVTLSTDQVVLEALCAYRDELIMSDDYGTPAVQARLLLLPMAIEDAANACRR